MAIIKSNSPPTLETAAAIHRFILHSFLDAVHEPLSTDTSLSAMSFCVTCNVKTWVDEPFLLSQLPEHCSVRCLFGQPCEVLLYYHRDIAPMQGLPLLASDNAINFSQNIFSYLEHMRTLVNVTLLWSFLRSQSTALQTATLWATVPAYLYFHRDGITISSCCWQLLMP